MPATAGFGHKQSQHHIRRGTSMKILSLACCVAILGSANAATVLITGSDRGLGLEFVRQYAARGDTVIATCRHPETATELRALAAERKSIIVETLDVSDDANIRTLAAKYRGKPIDVLINNAGVLGAHDDQTFGTFNRKSFQEVMDVNAFAPLAVSEAFRENVISSKDKKVLAVTSGAGSISRSGDMPKGPYYYRMSKAALNMGMQALGADLRAQGVAVAVVSPGATDTDMFAAFSTEYGVKFRSNAPPVSVAGMISVIDKLDQKQGAQGILNFDGTITPW
jgi:NAD(P)-dependent dehydrogenase (short-subunit alcohol dehydrogenase family)